MTPQEAIQAMLARRRSDTSICPSEAARLLDPADWRTRLPEIHEAAAGMIEDGQLLATQKGKSVDIRTARGALRLKLPPA
ncbi:MAG: DUF3253 domain-containing protein [Pseudomonadota bacterium]